MGLPEALPAMDRRALLKSAILLVGGSLAGLPSAALAQGPSQARFFTAAQFATLAEVAEVIIPRTDTPGAKDAGVAESIDSLMTNWASARRRADFRKLIDDIDRTALAADGKPLPALSAEKKVEIVRAYDEEKIRGGDQVYSRFKELVLTAYYLSEPGATKELRYELIPGKFEPGVEISPDTRAWAV